MCVITFDWEENDAIEKFRSFGKTRSISWSVLELTDSCNFKCKWCFANMGHVKRPVHMKINDVEKIITTLADIGVTQITYSGGEPTLYPHLKEAVSIAMDYGMIVHMNTNGYLLTKSMASELKNLGLSQVQINIDSIYPKEHDAVRGREGSFGRAIKALDNAKAVGMTCVSQTVLTNENEADILEIIRLARDRGIQRCRLWDMTPSSGYAKENSRLLPKDYISAVQDVADFAYETGAKNVEVGDPLFKQNIKTKLNISGGYCTFAAGVIQYISINGDVYFCCTLRDGMYNIFEEIAKGSDIRDVHTQGITQYLKPFKLPNGCQNCGNKSLCKGGCYTRRNFSENNIDYWCKTCTG